jgi:hypothetical protein
MGGTRGSNRLAAQRATLRGPPRYRLMSTQTSRRALLACLAAAATLLCAAPAGADDAVADLAADTPLSAYGGALAWSDYDAASERYALVIRQGEATAAAPIAKARRAFDVSLGPDARGRVVALYTRCRVARRGRAAERGCDVYRYDLRTRRESKLASVSSPKLDEAWPAQWRGRIAFARRARAHTIDGYNHRPDPRGRGPLLDCDIPYVKTLASRAASRRLDRSQCGATTGTALRGETIVVTTDINQGGAGSESQVRRLRTGGGAARILQLTRGGEGGYSPFVAPTLSSSAVWLTRTGRREGVQQGFLRIDLQSARLTTVPANLNFTGSIARDERGRFWYVQGPEPDFDFELPCDLVLEPCRLVRASASPFSSTPRTLLPRLLIDGRSDLIMAFAADPPVLAGELSRTIVRKGAVVGREPVAGVALTLLRTGSIEQPGSFIPTGLTTTTDANGRWAFALRTPPPQIALAVQAAALKVASHVVEVTSSSRMTLSATGRSLSGTVAPGQPGRSAEIQRLIVDSRGRLPSGRQVCGLPVSAATCSDEAWSTVAQAPLDAAGTAFAATVTGPGIYRARLSYDPTPQGQATAYGGVSNDVRVDA